MSIHSMLTAGKKKATYVKISEEVQGASDGMGGYADPTWTVIYRRVLCRFNQLTKEEQEIKYGGNAVEANYIVFLEYLSGIREGMKLIKLDDDREFMIKLKIDWDEDKSYLKLAVLEQGRTL